jgi:hypothetical protein
MDFKISTHLITPDGIYINSTFNFDIYDFKFINYNNSYSVDVKCNGNNNVVNCTIKALFININDVWVPCYTDVTNFLKNDINFLNEMEIQLLETL